MQLYYIFIYLLLFVNLNSIFVKSLDPSQEAAINAINDVVSQFNTADICNGNPLLIKCDGNNDFITELGFFSLGVLTTVPTADLLSITTLKKLSFSENLNVDANFWNGMGVLTSLNRLYVYKLYVITPDLGDFFPLSLNETSIERLDGPLPESLFTAPGLKVLSLGTQNGPAIDILPASISSPSQIEDLNLGIATGTLFTGENFLKLKTLSINFRLAELTFDAFNTFPNVETLFLQLRDTVPISQYPGSITGMSKIKYHTFHGESRLTTPLTQLNFVSTQISQISFYEFNILEDLIYPGITIGNNDTIPATIVIYNTPNVNLNVLKMDVFNQFMIFTTSNIVGGIPSSQNFSTLSQLSVTAPMDITVIPENVCQIDTVFFDIPLTSIPDCFICDWGSTISPNRFQNSGLSLTPSCDSVSVTNYSTNSIYPNGGFITITGNNIGWNVFNQNNVKINTQVKLANSILITLAPPGYGLNKTFVVKFHADVIPTAPEFNILVNYMPPRIYSLSGGFDGSFSLNGECLGNSTITSLEVSGVPVPLVSVSYSDIQTITGIYPISFQSFIMASLKITVDGQTVETVTNSFNTIVLYKPFPRLYYEGGTVTFKGEYLSFDTTLVNLTVNGVLFRLQPNISSPSQLTFEYDAIPLGNYTLVFNQYTYQTTGIINVGNVACKVVHGHCVGQTPVCDPPYTGPDCSSIPGNLTMPSVDLVTPYPDFTKDAILSYAGNSYDFGYQITIGEIREINNESIVVKTYSNLVFNNNPGPTTNQFTSDIGGPMFYDITGWYENATFVSFGNINEPVIHSSQFFKIAFSSYVPISNDNHLEVDIKMNLKLAQDNNNACSFVSTPDVLPILDSFNYFQMKIDHIDLFTRLYRTCLYNSVGSPCAVPKVKKMNTTSNSNVDVILTLPINNPSTPVFIWDLDFNIYYDETSAKNEISPLCKTSTPKPTSPSCKGSPVCYGNGVCVSGACKCNKNFFGTDCENENIVIPPIKPNPSEPESNTTKDEVGIHVSVISIRERDFRDNVIKTFNVTKWTYTKEESEIKKTLYYKSILPNNSTIFVTIDYFYQDSVVYFGGISSTKLKGSLKYSANITQWPFVSGTNNLEVVFVTIANDNEESDDTCTFKKIVKDSNNNVDNIQMQVNDKLFVSKFNDIAVVDGDPIKVRNVLINSPESDTSTKTQAYVGIISPHFRDYLIIDPDFSLLINYVPPKDKEGSICKEKSKGLSKAKIAGIVIGSVAFAAAITAGIIYGIKFNRNKKKLVKHIQSRLNNNNNKL